MFFVNLVKEHERKLLAKKQLSNDWKSLCYNFKSLFQMCLDSLSLVDLRVSYSMALGIHFLASTDTVFLYAEELMFAATGRSISNSLHLRIAQSADCCHWSHRSPSRPFLQAGIKPSASTLEQCPGMCYCPGYGALSSHLSLLYG